MATVKELEDRLDILETFVKQAFGVDEIPPADAPEEVDEGDQDE